MRRRAALVLPLLLAACSLQHYLDREPRPPADQGAWAAARDGATRKGAIYDGLATNALVSAVYQSPAVREARVARVATWQALSRADRDRLLATERDEAGRWDDFLVALFTPDRTANDLDAPRTTWRVALVVPEGGEQAAQEVVAVRPDPTLRALYPNIGDFDTVYRVRFARVDPPLSGRRFTLRLAGAEGRLDLDFATPAR